MFRKLFPKKDTIDKANEHSLVFTRAMAMAVTAWTLPGDYFTEGMIGCPSLHREGGIHQSEAQSPLHRIMDVEHTGVTDAVREELRTSHEFRQTVCHVFRDTDRAEAVQWAKDNAEGYCRPMASTVRWAAEECLIGVASLPPEGMTSRYDDTTFVS